ncbi:MAG: anhydro-N-acetylmuramic acid kinase [Candidatus Kapaibacterium sp.]
MSDNLYIGMMTGTSLDGIDTVICEFKENGDDTSFVQHYFKTYPIPFQMKQKILHIIEENIRIEEVSQLNFALSRLYADAVESALNVSGIDKKSIKSIGVHGQTIWHKPSYDNFAGINTASTLQAGNISALAALTGIPVIGDFRAADIAVGGQGAPLVPIFDYTFLRSKVENRVMLNLGGIANITYIKKNASLNSIIAFDTGPGNMLIDIVVKKYYNFDYDDGGRIAESSFCNHELLDKLMMHDFIQAKPPKSCGRELYNSSFIDDLCGHVENPASLIATLTHFTALSIAENIRHFVPLTDRIIISGGGAKNSFLRKLIKNYINIVNLDESDAHGINIDAKESLCFAFLAYLYDKKMYGNIPSVTGAKRRKILGSKSY